MGPRATPSSYDSSRYFRITAQSPDKTSSQYVILPEVVRRLIDHLQEIGTYSGIEITGNQVRKGAMPPLKNTIPPQIPAKKPLKDLDVLLLDPDGNPASFPLELLNGFECPPFIIDRLSPRIHHSFLFSVDGLFLRLPFGDHPPQFVNRTPNAYENFSERKLSIVTRGYPERIHELFRLIKIVIKLRGRYFNIDENVKGYFRRNTTYQPIVEQLEAFINDRDLFDYHDDDNLSQFGTNLHHYNPVHQALRRTREDLLACFSNYFKTGKATTGDHG